MLKRLSSVFLFLTLLMFSKPLLCFNSNIAQLSPVKINEVCSHNFKNVDKGASNITVANFPKGESVIIAAGSSIKNPSGHILFFANQNYSVWWTQTSGNQSFSFLSDGAVVGYLSCYLGASMKLLKFSQGESVYNLSTQNYSRFLVIVTCFGEFNSCENASVQKNNLTRLGDYGKNFVVAIFYGFVNFTGSYITVEVPSGSSTVFLIGISNSIFGWIRGTVEPKDSVILINGTRYFTNNGVLNISLPFGIYNVTILKKGYSNLSIIVPVYGGEVTPLFVKLANAEDRLIVAVDFALRYYLPALLAACAIALGVYSLKRTPPFINRH
jgi:hypothetical protein